MSNRLISLLSRLHLLNRYTDASISNIKYVLNTAINWELTNEELNSWRNESSRLLLHQLQ